MYILFFYFLFVFSAFATVVDISRQNENISTVSKNEIVSTIISRYDGKDSSIQPIDDSGSDHFSIDNEGRYNIKNTKKNFNVSVKDPNKTSDYKVRDDLDIAYREFNDGNIFKALEHYHLAYNHSNGVDAMFGIAICHQVLGEKDKAIEFYLKILDVKPKYAPAIHNLMLIIAEEDIDIAIKILTLISKNKDVDPLLLNQLGTLINETGEYLKSIRLFKMAIERDPKNPVILYNMAVTFDAMEKQQQAIIFYNKCLDSFTNEYTKLINIDTIKDRIKFLSTKTLIKT